MNRLPKTGINIGQYLWCWIVVLCAHATPEASHLTRGLLIYLYVASVSLAATALFMKLSGRNGVSLTLCVLEAFAILWIPPSLWANIAHEANFFHSNFKASLNTIYLTQIAVLIVVGLYGLAKLVWMAGRRLCNRGDHHHHKSLLYPFLYERRKRERR